MLRFLAFQFIDFIVRNSNLTAARGQIKDKYILQSIGYFVVLHMVLHTADQSLRKQLKNKTRKIEP